MRDEQTPVPRVSVVICAFNGERWLHGCLGSLRLCAGSFETIVVDNGSRDATAEFVEREYPEARLLRTGRNLGFAGGNNVGIAAAHGELIVLLNQDTEVAADALRWIEAAFDADPRIGAVGCKLLYGDRRTIQHAGAVLFPNGNTLHLGVGEADNGQHDTPRECDYVTGAALGLRRTALAQAGLLDEGYFPAYFEELDLLMRLRAAGWKVWYEPRASLVHHESQTLGVGSPRFVETYTVNRLRYIALNGTTHGKRAALRAELAWIWSWLGKGGLGKGGACAVLRAYGRALGQWSGWRAERLARPRVPRL